MAIHDPESTAQERQVGNKWFYSPLHFGHTFLCLFQLALKIGRQKRIQVPIIIVIY